MAASAAAAEVELGPDTGPQLGGQLVGGTERPQAAPVQHGHAVGQAPGLAEEVGGEHDGAALGGQLVDEGDDVAGAGRVEARGRLVEEEQLGVVQQGPGQGDPLALSGREAAGEIVGAARPSRTARAARRPASGRRPCRSRRSRAT